MAHNSSVELNDDEVTQMIKEAIFRLSVWFIRTDEPWCTAGLLTQGNTGSQLIAVAIVQIVTCTFVNTKPVLPPTLVTVGVVFVACTLLTIGLIGNFLVVYVVLRNATMRTTTNIFLVNLAVADGFVLIFCLPPTVIWDLTKTWWFSTAGCKATLYLQHVTVTVMLLTMVAISIERYQAIVRPFRFVATNRWTANVLLLVWISGLLFALPEPISLEKQYYDYSEVKANFTSEWLATCTNTLFPEYEGWFWLAHALVLFVFPLSVIGVMYGIISYMLWAKSKQLELAETLDRQHTATALLAETTPRSHTNTNSPRPSIRSHCGGSNPNNLNSKHNRHIEGRRKAAKMLIVVVVLFAICYSPVFAYNLLIAWDALPAFIAKSAVLMDSVAFMTRFLMYFNCCINPILYNFMSEKFQREFRKTLPWCATRSSHGAGAPRLELPVVAPRCAPGYRGAPCVQRRHKQSAPELVQLQQRPHQQHQRSSINNQFLSPYPTSRRASAESITSCRGVERQRATSTYGGSTLTLNTLNKMSNSLDVPDYHPNNNNFVRLNTTQVTVNAQPNNNINDEKTLLVHS